MSQTIEQLRQAIETKKRELGAADERVARYTLELKQIVADLRGYGIKRVKVSEIIDDANAKLASLSDLANKREAEAERLLADLEATTAGDA